MNILIVRRATLAANAMNNASGLYGKELLLSFYVLSCVFVSKGALGCHEFRKAMVSVFDQQSRIPPLPL
jgi:hypothetical protein